jgi:L-fucose isomerase-like protein
MITCKMGLVAVASRFESGGERAEVILPALAARFGEEGVKIVSATRVAWNVADAIAVSEEMTRGDIDALVLVHLSWVQDSITYLFITTVKRPVLLWGLPFAETFSIACVQHSCSVLRSRGVRFEYACGLPDDIAQIRKSVGFARAAAAAKKLGRSVIGMVGPRQTWRIAGAQDMTSEEWEITDKLGFRIAHIEMDELRGMADALAEQDARAVLREKRKAFPGLSEEADGKRLLYGAKVYLAVKRLFTGYGLAAAAVQCYPLHGGIANLASSWLADEGVVLDTEGDIAHTTVLLALGWLCGGAPAALAEPGAVDPVDDCVHLVHEGSSAMSLAVDGGVIAAAAEEGAAVGFTLREMSPVTVAGLNGAEGRYRMLLSRAASVPVSRDAWLRAGRKFHAAIRFPVPAAEVLDTLIGMGVDHHLIVKQGDCLAALQHFCRIVGIEPILLTECGGSGP